VSAPHPLPRSQRPAGPFWAGHPRFGCRRCRAQALIARSARLHPFPRPVCSAGGASGQLLHPLHTCAVYQVAPTFTPAATSGARNLPKAPKGASKSTAKPAKASKTPPPKTLPSPPPADKPAGL
jgi:hypothetical protein